MRTLPLLLTVSLVCLLPATGTAQPRATTSGDSILARAARAYREAPAVFASVRYVVRIPGAPAHEESQEFGRSAAVEAWIRMPSLYVMQAQQGRLYLVEEGRLEPHTEASMDAGLQAAIDSAFGGQGPPLAPAPLLLARAASDAERRNAFRMKLLGPLRVAGVRSIAGSSGAPCDEVELVAANGSVRARFDQHGGWLLGASLAFVPAPGADTIRAEASYTPLATSPPPMLPEDRLRSGRRVSELAALSGDVTSTPKVLDPGSRFFSRDGARVGLSSLDTKLVVFEFWASWCAPCRVAIPRLATFAQWARDSAPDVAVVLINTEEQESSVSELRTRVDRYLEKLNVRVPCWIDSGGTVHRTLGSGLPMTLILEPGGRILELHSGFQDTLADTLKQHVRKRLAGSP